MLSVLVITEDNKILKITKNMKYRKTIFGLVLATSLITTVVQAQTPTNGAKSSPKKTLVVNVEQVLGTPNLADPKFWLMVGIILGAGSLGGLVFELLNLQGNIELPHKPTEDALATKFAYAHPKNVVDLGVVSRLIIGALAAPPAIAVIRPETAFVLLATSAVAGSAGTLIFRALQDRLLAAVLQTSKVGDEIRAIESNQPLTKAIEGVEKLEQEVRKQSESSKGNPDLEFTKDAIIDPNDFDTVSKLLYKLKEGNPKVNEAIEDFKQLEQEVRDQSESPRGTTKLKISKGTVLKGEWINKVDKVKRLLVEAQGETETSTPADSSTPSQSTPETKEIRQ